MDLTSFEEKKRGRENLVLKKRVLRLRWGGCVGLRLFGGRGTAKGSWYCGRKMVWPCGEAFLLGVVFSVSCLFLYFCDTSKTTFFFFFKLVFQILFGL